MERYFADFLQEKVVANNFLSSSVAPLPGLCLVTNTYSVLANCFIDQHQHLLPT